MEHCIEAPSDGLVTEFYFQPGDLVDGGAELLAFESSDRMNLSAIGKNCRSGPSGWFAK